MKLVSQLIALGAMELVRGEIIIHNNRIEESLHNLGHWAAEEINSKEFGQLARSVMTANEKAGIENLHANKQIMNDTLHLAQSYIDAAGHFVGMKDCSAEVYSHCMSGEPSWKQDAMGWSDQWAVQDIQCWKLSGCYKDWQHQDEKSKLEIESDFKQMGDDASEIKHKWIWAQDNWKKDIQGAVESHHKQLDSILGNLEDEVKHIMVQGGCNETCVDKMKDDGMMDDPSYVAYECQCADKWVVEVYHPQNVNVTENIEIEEVPTELTVKTATVPAKSSSGAIHLTQFTCACIVIFAVQIIICFFMLQWCAQKLYRSERSKVAKQSEFYEFLYEFHEQMANEGDANAAIEGTPGGTPGGRGGTPGK